MKIQLTLLSVFLSGLTSICVAQDTLKLDLRSAEKLFLENNYQLIAQNYETEQAKAEVITARLFDNPELSYESLLYNPETKKFFQNSMPNGQFTAGISWLVKLAGKRNKNIQLAGTGVKLQEYAYFDLMRTLKFDLRSTFYKAYYTQQSAKVYQQQLTGLERLLASSELQLKMGNIALKDIIRIKSQVYTIKSEYTMLVNEMAELETTLKTLTSLNSNTPLALTLTEDEQTAAQINIPAYVELLETAKTNRADLQIAKTAISYAENNLKVQKAMAVPDVEISLAYDLQANYPINYSGLGIKMPIPFLNRNQGEIKKAKIAIDASANSLKQQEATVENEVYKSYVVAQRTEELYKGLDQNFSTDFSKLIAEVTKNFSSRNISLIEFLDFYDSYRENILQMNNLKYERMNAKEEINYVTGSTIFK
ncbi:MAG: TolC family protein [Pedobacter sp.]|nr:MAG: TolC family protein [Pedobacter sp.]